MDLLKEKFRRYLWSNNLKLTPERVMILDEVRSRTDHFEAEDLVLSLKAKKKRVSRATVYRTLEILHELGIVSKATLGHNHAHFENMVDRKHHDHLICLKCERVIEFYEDDLEKFQDKVCENLNFKPIRHNLQIFGYCEKCKKHFGSSIDRTPFDFDPSS